MMKEEELLKKLREAFKAEADERIENMSSSLIALEKTADLDERKSILEAIFRDAHSLKGAARAVNFAEIETLCQAIEGVFAALKKESISLSEELFDVLHRCIDAIENLIAETENEEEAPSADNIGSLVRQLRDLQAGRIADPSEMAVSDGFHGAGRGGRTPVKSPSPTDFTGQAEDGEQKAEAKDQLPPHNPRLSETVRIPASRLNSLLLQGEELISVKLLLNQNLKNLQETMRSFEHWENRNAKADEDVRTVRSLIKMTDHTALKGLASVLENLLAFIDWNHEQVRTLKKQVGTQAKAAVQDYETTGRMVDDLLEEMKTIMMLPFSTLFAVFPRMVREISMEQGKETDLVLNGEDVEIDRRILEQMKDPLIHLIRNSIDHGLEDPETREKKGKPRRGTIALSIARTGGSKIDIVVSDDGRGIDPDRVKEKAVTEGIISKKEAQNLTDEEAVHLIFHSGISTSSIVTEISGRGIGMAIVQESVEKLGGTFSVENRPGQGISFKMQLPVTLATFKGILVRVAGNLFIVPSTNVRRAVKISRDEVKTVENREIVTLNGRPMSLVDLARALGLSKRVKPDEKKGFIHALILGTAEKAMVFRVDKVLDEQEVLVKSLGRQLVRVPNIAGASILGDGSVAPILDVQDLLKSRLKHADEMDGITELDEEMGSGTKSILVAEDSITSRTLIKNILETAGYRVKTAVDGRDAYSALKTGRFDLVVSDIEMPRMDGFELTKRIRSDSTISKTPVVLVTSLESREDREKGIDVGANAYIIKRSFDQSNLLDVIQRLV